MDDQKIKEVCKLGQKEATCRYLMAGPAGFECAKNTKIARALIDARVEAGDFVAQGDNCDGEPPLKIIKCARCNWTLRPEQENEPCPGCSALERKNW